MGKIKNEMDVKNKTELSEANFIEITFEKEDDERAFLRDIAKTFSEKFVASALIHDLDTSIELYKNYFSLSGYSIFENDPTHPFISSSELKSQEINDVIDNFGYYTLDAYLYWSKERIDFRKVVNTPNYFATRYSEIAIRQVLDLSLEIQVSNEVISEFKELIRLR